MLTNDEKKLVEAYEKLNKLAVELGVIVGGCGCCGSPFMELRDGDELKPALARCDDVTLGKGLDKKMLLREYDRPASKWNNAYHVRYLFVADEDDGNIPDETT